MLYRFVGKVLLTGVFLLLVSGKTAFGQDETKETGYLKVSPQSSSFFYIIVDDQYEGARGMTSGDSLQLPVGEHRITLATTESYDHSFTVEIIPDTTRHYELNIYPATDFELYLKFSSFPPLHLDANARVHTDEDSEVYVDGEHEARGEALLTLPAGNHTIRTVHPHYGESRETVTIREDGPLRLRVVELYNRPSQSIARRLSIVPGASQIYKQEVLKGVAIAGLFATVTSGSIWQHRSFLEWRGDYVAMRQRYQQAETEEGALRMGNEAEALYRGSRQRYWTRNTLIAATTALYALNVFDAWQRPAHGYRAATSVETQLYPLLFAGDVGVSVIIEF